MLISIVDFLLTYVGIFIGVIVQAFFLLLPVNFKNWDDDTLYVLTYIGLQGMTAAILFVLLPSVLEIKTLQYNTLFILITSICILAAFRALKIIPMEFTFPVKQEFHEQKKILFTEFYDAKRFAILAEIPFDLPDAEVSYNSFREKLMRTRAEDNESILEALISQENNMDY